MTGSWRVLDVGSPRSRAPRGSCCAAASARSCSSNGPVLELMTESRTRFDQRLSRLGPDILAPELDVDRFLRRLREDDPTRPIGDALLDQRTIAGIGNMWKAEGCFAAGGRPVAAGGRGHRRRGARDRRRTCGRGCSARRPTATRTPTGASTRWPGGRARAAARRSARAARATTTARRTGARHVRGDAPARRPQGRRPHRARQHDGVVRRRAGRARRHDRVRRAARRTTWTRQRSPLILAHDYEHVDPDSLTLEQGLAHLAAPQFADVELDVDLKLPGYEARVVEALRRHDLVERTIVSTLYMRSLVALRELEPRLRLGWSVPRVRRDYTSSALTAAPAWALLLRMRRRLPAIAAAHVRAGRCDALMAHWRLVTPRLVRDAARGRRRPLRLDRRRRGADPAARGARRHRRDHERPAPVRRG